MRYGDCQITAKVHWYQVLNAVCEIAENSDAMVFSDYDVERLERVVDIIRRKREELKDSFVQGEGRSYHDNEEGMS